MRARAKPGEGRPYQRQSDGLWVVAVRDRENRRRYLSAVRVDDVIAKRDRWNATLQSGVTPAPNRLTVGRVLDDWLADRRGRIRPSTWVSYELLIRLHLATITRIPLARLEPADVRRLMREREIEGCAPRTIGNALTVLRMALRQAQRDGLIARNVAELVTGPRITRAQLAVWTRDEARRFRIGIADHPLGGLWTLMLGIGCRLGEGLGLRWVDVDLAGGRLTVSGAVRPVDRRFRGSAPRLQRVEPKTDESWRTIAVADFVVQALLAERQRAATRPASSAGYIFTTPRGTPWDPRNVSRQFDAAIAEVGLKRIRMHDLRHTCAALLLEDGYTLEDIKQLFGHRSIVTTSDQYGHLVEGRSREVAAGMQRAIGGAG